MALTIEQFHANFDPYPVPRLLEDLLEFQNISQEWYSLGFELNVVKRSSLKHHILAEAIPQFFVFGHDGNQSFYALWRYKEMPADETPVIYLNSEGEGSGVLANNLAEFMTLLAYGTEPILGIYPDQAEANEEIKYALRNQEFRVWIEQRYSLYVADHPNDMVQQARQRHPKVPLLVYG